ncbi:MAG: DinB family protein [Candidatus Rokuibacteriota bacterium]
MSARRAAMEKDTVRAEVRNLVHGPSYMSFDEVVEDFPMNRINTRPPNVPYTPWHLLEHMRIAQRDILEYIEDKNYRPPRWPEDYWPDPAAQADAKAWKKTVAAFRRDRGALEKIAGNARIPLGAPLPHAKQHTYIRELLIASEHNTYHIGELAILRQVMGAWPANR